MAAAGPKALVRGPDGKTFVQSVTDLARAAGAAGVVVVIASRKGEV